MRRPHKCSRGASTTRSILLSNATTIDSKINTVENKLGIEEINRLSSSNANPSLCDDDSDVMEELISRFASAQVMQVVDIWCTQEENQRM